MLTKIIYLLRLIPKLGYWNFFYMIWYRLSMRLGIRKKKFPNQPLQEGVFFSEVTHLAQDFKEEWTAGLLSRAKEILNGTFVWFSYHKHTLTAVPNWFSNPFDGSSISNNNVHWTDMSDFALETGDVKIIWELSRFDWLTDLARAYKVTGDARYLDRINLLLNDWSKNNPLNIGVNWKCGQEAGFRVMKLITTAMILDQYESPSNVLQDLIYQHLRRIDPNIYYSIAQDNNHGTTETAALYIGSAWLMHVGFEAKELGAWKRKGRKLLIGRIVKLIQKDGSFAQRSMTYHRVVVDTMTWLLAHHALLNLPKFDEVVYKRLQKLGEWQYKMTFGKEGDAPNFGSNDGANIGNLNTLSYRDFRGSTQAFFAVLSDTKVYDLELVNETAYWYGKTEVASLNTRQIDLPSYEILDDHVLIIRKGNANAFVRLPDVTFRPGTDAFHLDLWTNGENILRDNGSFSYNAGAETDTFKSVQYHNTLRFVDHEQMPKFSRFLNAEWLKTDYSRIVEDDDSIKWEGQYTDYKGCKHKRQVECDHQKIVITDEGVGGDFEVNYHLSTKEDYSRIESQCENVEKTSFTSSFYMEKRELPLLTLKGKTRIKTVIAL